MMQNLTSRLRQTNAKVQDLEERLLEIDPSATGSTVLPFQKFPFQHSLCFGRVLLFTLKTDGEKSGTEYVIPFEGTRGLWDELYPARADLFDVLVAAYTDAGFISKRKQYIVFHNKGQLAAFIDFAGDFSHQFDIKNPYFTKEAMSLFTGLVQEVNNSGYENFSVNLKEFIAAKKATHEDAPKWGKAAAELKKIPLVKLAKNGNDIQVKLNNKEHSKILGHMKILDTLRSSKAI